MRIVLCYETKPQYLEQIAAAAPQAEIVDAGQKGIAKEILGADIYCGHAKVPVPWKEVIARGKLEWIQSSAAGLDHCLVPEVVASDILVTSASGLFANQVAEQTMALLLGLLRGLPIFFRQMQSQEFIRRPTGDLHGKTIGILGLGGNGRRLVEVLRPYGVRILATDWYPVEKPEAVERLAGADEVDAILPEVDILILCVPLTSYTEGMINSRRLALLKPGSYVINVARGPVVVERDLIAALESGRLAGAGLDVTEVEPLPPKSPLWRLPNVLITPHVGAQGRTRNEDVTAFFCENLRRYLSRKPLANLVDKRLGFPQRG